jgi:hypothetical protein
LTSWRRRVPRIHCRYMPDAPLLDFTRRVPLSTCTPRRLSALFLTSIVPKSLSKWANKASATPQRSPSTNPPPSKNASTFVLPYHHLSCTHPLPLQILPSTNYLLSNRTAGTQTTPPTPPSLPVKPSRSNASTGPAAKLATTTPPTTCGMSISPRFIT